MKIIDFEKHGNVVRFYLGENSCKDYWGDDWNDAPYDCNAGEVYDRYVSGYIDIAFPFDWSVLEPSDGVYNCRFTKEDMKRRFVPCIIAVPDDILGKSCYMCSFNDWVGAEGVYRFYFEDEMDASDHLTIWGC